MILIADLEMGIRVKQQDTIDLAINSLIDVYSECTLAKTLNIKQHYIDKLFYCLMIYLRVTLISDQTCW